MSKSKFEQKINVADKEYTIYSLKAAEAAGLKNIAQLPFSLKILLENQLRHLDGTVVTDADLEAFPKWLNEKCSKHEIAYHPARVLMQDFTGVPAVVDLATMRNAAIELGTDPEKINPLCPVDLVIDHSVQIDKSGTKDAFAANVELEMQRNKERYTFLRWGQNAFDNFRVVPPGTGICHQVNLEYLAKTVWHAEKDGINYAYPDTLVGTDSHTTMINGLGVLGWGVGGIEAEAAMLGQPISMLIPEVIGMKLSGELATGITATDLVLRVTERLREEGVVGKFVEFFGPGLQHLSLADRATISNMAPEYGATCGLFPIDQKTCDYLEQSGRSAETIELVKTYTKAQGMWHDADSGEATYSKVIELDLNSIEAAIAGPTRPQDRVALSDLPNVIEQIIAEQVEDKSSAAEIDGEKFTHGDVVIAAITSCTNTSNPSVMMAAGLLAKNAIAHGLTVKPWVKTSLAPGSKVVTRYLQQAKLLEPLNKLGFNVVGYGCTTCIGNSGPLADDVSQAIDKNNLHVSAVLSGNRNFEGRIHPQVRANWLGSPPLVVAYALTGTMRIDLNNEPLGNDPSGKPVYLKDIWPTPMELEWAMEQVKRDMFDQEYADVFSGDSEWQNLESGSGQTYEWQEKSTYVRHPPFFHNMQATANEPENVTDANVLAVLGDSITTDHISPAGAIKSDSPAGKYLQENGVSPLNFNSYGSRRGNHEVMMRGTFANIRIRNEMTPDIEGGFTKHIPSAKQMPIYDAAMEYAKAETPLVIFAGKEYGTGSSRDWAAKGTLLLGVKAVIAESFERIHRSNLIGMGVLPLRFMGEDNRKSLSLDGSESISISGLEAGMQPGMELDLHIKRADGSSTDTKVKLRIETENELNYYKNGGILSYVLRKML